MIKNLLKPLAKSGLIPLRLKAATLATDPAIHKKMFGSALTVSNEEMNNIMKVVESLKESGLLIKGVSKTIKSEAKEHKGGFSSMLLGGFFSISALSIVRC